MLIKYFFCVKSSKQISQSKTTDMSAISVATGRRTIYPHANAVHFLTDDMQLYIAPTSLLMIVVTLFAGIALSTCYFMVLNAEIDVKYVRDAAILSCALLISLGTFLEVLISSGMMHFAGIADEIDFEKEVRCCVFLIVLFSSLTYTYAWN